MTRCVSSLLLLGLFTVASSGAAADPRIRTILYGQERVIPLTGHYGYQMSIEFPPGERIENVAIGDSLAWQVTPNKRGDVLFLKPVDLGETTNMTVMTAERRYSFELAARNRKSDTPLSEITYALRIRLPDIAGDEPLPPEEPVEAPPRAIVNTSYSYTGSPANLPSRVYDDGVATTFEWPAGAQAPAIFAQGPDGKEVIVNFSYADGGIVVHQIAETFVLRNGSQVTYLHNEGYSPPAPGPDAPKPKKKKGFLFFGGSD